jgi:ABC-type transporter Mla subunit MlaD
MPNQQPSSPRTARGEIVDRLVTTILRMMPLTAETLGILDLLKDLAKQRTQFDKKIARASEALRETSSLLSELEAGLEERVEKLEEVRAQYEQYSKLAQVEEQKAHALLQQIELTVAKGRGKERFISLALNLIAGLIVFVLGVYFGPKLTEWLGIRR